MLLLVFPDRPDLPVTDARIGLKYPDDGQFAPERRGGQDAAPHKGLLVHPDVWIGEGPAAGLEARMIGVWATRQSTVLAIVLAAFRRVAASNPDLCDTWRCSLWKTQAAPSGSPRI